jgi:hypothetical protein
MDYILKQKQTRLYVEREVEKFLGWCTESRLHFPEEHAIELKESCKDPDKLCQSLTYCRSLLERYLGEARSRVRTNSPCKQRFGSIASIHVERLNIIGRDVGTVHLKWSNDGSVKDVFVVPPYEPATTLLGLKAEANTEF